MATNHTTNKYSFTLQVEGTDSTLVETVREKLQAELPKIYGGSLADILTERSHKGALEEELSVSISLTVLKKS